jgi:hypothetical protein
MDEPSTPEKVARIQDLNGSDVPMTELLFSVPEGESCAS